MAPLPVNGTDRLKVTYSGPFGTHTMMFRAPDGETHAGLVEDVQALVPLMAAAQYDGTIWGTAEYSVSGSDIFLPESDWVAVTSDSGINPSGISAPSAFLEFGGRSAGGRRVKFYLFETFFAPSEDMKVDGGESVIVDTIIGQLNDDGSEICAIDGLVTTYYSYANLGQNDYLTHRARRS